MKKHLTTILLVVLLITGLMLLLYPSFSNYYNSLHQTRAIINYETALSQIDEEKYEQMMEAAHEYNDVFVERGGLFEPEGERKELYESLLNPDGTGMMGYVNIQSIRVTLPLYHGTSDSVLQFATGHVTWSSLPVGGESTHSIISGHRGLPTAKLFTNLDRLRVGDTFKLNVLNETLTYEVDEIRVVLPAEASQLDIVPGKDYCTLLTCTPYGINTHRLLVRGHRIATAANVHVASDAVRIEKLVVAACIAVPTFLLIILYVMIRYRTRRTT